MFRFVVDDLVDELGRVIGRSAFSGTVAVWGPDGRIVTVARGHAHRGRAIPATADTRYAVASATKGVTALVIASLVGDGALEFDTRFRSVVGDLLSMVDDRVTIEQLLAHTSGVGDYLDESLGGDVDDHVLTVPAHQLESPREYRRVIDGFPQAFAPGERFEYNNGAYVMLSIVAEIVSETSFYDLVTERVTRPAGMQHTGFLRSDRLDGDVAVGYLEDGRSNVFHLPVRGAGDGGMYTTVADIERFWHALFAGDIVPLEVVEWMTAPTSVVPGEGMRYGRGFWLAGDGPEVTLGGKDAGVSFRSTHDPTTGHGYVVVSNTSSGTWPVAAVLESHLGGDASVRTGRASDKNRHAPTERSTHP